MRRLFLLLKIFLLTAVISSSLVAGAAYNVMVKKYDYDVNNDRYIQIGDTQTIYKLTANTVINQISSNSKVKRVEFYIPLNQDRFSSKFNTLQSKLLTDNRANSESTPINLSDYQYRFFIGLVSKNFGIFSGWLLTKGIFKDRKTGKLYTKLTAEKVNWLNYFTNKAWNFYELHKTSPLIIFNTFSFINAINLLADNQDLNSKAKSYVYKDPGVLRLNNSDFISKDYVRNRFKNLYSHRIFTGTKAHWSVGSDTGKLFRDNGYIIAYPYSDPEITASVAAAIFANFMNDKQVLSGYIITDEPMRITGKTWRTGKGGKRIHVQRDIFVNSSAIDIKHLTIVRPFKEYTSSLNWRDSQFSYATVINPFPSENPFILKITPDGHMTTHGFKQTSDLGSLGNMHISKEITWKLKFNWFMFVLITVVLVVAAIYTFGATFSAFGTWATTGALNSTQYLIMSIAGHGAMMSFTGVAASFVASTYISYMITLGNMGGVPGLGGISGNGAFFESYKHIVEKESKEYVTDLAKFESTNAKFITIPSIISKSDPVTLFSTKKYLELLNALHNTGNLSKLNENAFFKEYGSYGNYLLYENRTASKHTMWTSSIARNFYNLYRNNIFNFKPLRNSQLPYAIFGTSYLTRNYHGGYFMDSRKAMVYLINKVWGI